MREYAKVLTTFWTGDTGRRLRALGRDEQLLALFLITCPNANMIGLYHLPLSLIEHYLGSPFKGASKALRRVSEAGFAHYDPSAEEAWIPEMAAIQVGEPLQATDKRVVAIVREWNSHSKSKFYMAFHARYKDSFHLPEPKPLRSPFEAPSMGLPAARKPLRSHEQEQEQEHAQDQEQNLFAGASPAAEPVPTPAVEAKHSGPRPPNPLFDAVAEVTSSDPAVSGSHIGRVCKMLKAATPPYTPEEVRRWAQLVLTQWKMDGPPTLGMIEKHIGRIRAKQTQGASNGQRRQSLRYDEARDGGGVRPDAEVQGAQP